MSSKSLSLPFILVSTLLTLALGTWVLTAGLSRTIGKPAQAQELLNKSGIYQALIPSQVAEAQAVNPSLQNMPLDNPEVQKILGQSLDSQKLHEQGNKAVDAIYAWLEGKDAKPQINIAVAADQQELAKAAGDYAVQKASKLPTCAPGEADYNAFATDPLSVSCLPPGTDADMVRSTIESTVLGNPALGESTQLTENDIKLPNGKTIMDSFNAAPVWYQRAQLLPLISAITAGVCILLLLLIFGFRLGLRSAGKHLLSVGIVMAVVSIGLAWAFEKLYSSFVPKSSNPNITDALNQLSNLFNAAYRDNIVRLSAYLAIGGVLLLAVAWVLKLVHRPARKAAPVASKRPAAPVGEPESLAAAPTVASFTPSGPPGLPPSLAAPAARRTATAAKPKATRKSAAKRKPAARKPATRKKMK